jgi:hypothetical protein
MRVLMKVGRKEMKKGREKRLAAKRHKRHKG